MEFRGQVISDVDIHLTWKDPLNSNGIVRFYHIKIYNTKTGQQDRYLKVDSQSAGQQDEPQWVLIPRLKPYTNYTFTIQAVTIKPGVMANFTARTDEGGTCIFPTFSLQSNQVDRTPIDSINKSIICQNPARV